MSLFETAKARVLSNPPEKTGYCFRYVKYAIEDYYGIDKAKITGGSAIDAMLCLPKLGWVNMIDQYQTQLDAPSDSILVYSGGKHGHIEIASGDGVFISDFLARGNHKGRKLVGVFIRSEK